VTEIAGMPRLLAQLSPEDALTLTDQAATAGTGFQTLGAAAPGQVAHVRSHIDVLSPEQLRRLGRAPDG